VAKAKRPARRSRLLDAVRAFFADRPWWETTVLIVGAITVVTVIGVMVFGVSAKPRVVTLSDDLGAVDSPVFLASVSRLVGAPIEHGGTVTPLNNGDEFFPALLARLRAARSSINFSVFMWQDGEVSARVLEALVDRQQHGVQVRVLLDGLASIGASDPRFDDLEEAGGRVATFRTPKLGSWTRLHRRNHRRAIVIDGVVGFTGGMAVKDKWLGHAQDGDHWRDLMFEVTGPMAASLQSAFADVWAGTTGELLAGERMYPAIPSSSAPPFIHLVNSPADDDQSMAYFYLTAVLAARQRVEIATPYFIPDPPMMRALEERARAGVRVRLLLPGPETDNPWGRFSTRRHYQALMDAGVEIYEFQPTFLHSKFLVTDGLWSIVGSPNLNSRSRQLDEENAFGILDRALARRLEEIFSADLGRSKRIQPDEWRRRNPFGRLLEWLAKITDQQS
jgi:cardiolipin synthase